MTELENHKFELHLPGLLKVLAEHLYSTRQVAIRELIQNAHDSCIRRMVEGIEGSAYKPKILISIDHTNKVLVISDNGSGLSSDEIKMYLATIGRSYTRELNERIEFLSPTQESELIGQFGLGFLSSFLIASEVKLNTKSIKKDSDALSWQSVGNEYYQLSLDQNKQVGTEIRLKLKPDSMFLLQEQTLTDTIRKYADFLSIPIYLGDNPLPINLMKPPWDAEDVISATKEYITRVFNHNNPLWIIPLKNHTINLGHDTMEVPLKGFLYVPSSSIASVREYGDLSIYIKHMFICDNERELLPPWARFVRGVIDSPYLQPIASREGLHQNENFDIVQEALETQLTEELRSLAESSPDIWKGIVRGHSDIIIGWAVTNDDFFGKVADIVTFRTSRGFLNLSDYSKLTNSTLYYVSQEMGSLQEQLLGEGYDVPVIDASWFAVKPFLEKYVSWHPEIKLIQMDGQSKQLLRPIPLGLYSPLLTYYQNRGINARVAMYKPIEVPGLILHPEDSEWLTEARDALGTGEISGPLAELVDDYLSKRISKMTDDDINGILYLNDSCNLVRQLADNPPAENVRNTILDVIYQVARLFAGRTMKPADAVTSFREIVTSLQNLINQ
jgi:molecular chaperone HtpG